jgi:Putative Actinobacterial Holin-X, holin superfamily III
MPTQGTNGLGGATKHLADHAIAIAKLELKLALLELKKKAAALGVGVGLLVGAAIFGLFALGFLLAAAAAGLATAVSMWLALLIVGVVLVLITGVLGLLGRSSLKRGVPPVPEQAITEAKVTKEAVKANGSPRTGN